jgi:hypothetical protein
VGLSAAERSAAVGVGDEPNFGIGDEPNSLAIMRRNTNTKLKPKPTTAITHADGSPKPFAAAFVGSASPLGSVSTFATA